MSALAVARKEVRQLSRDPQSLIVHVALPAVMILLFGTVLSLDVRHVPLGVLDRDGSAASRSLVAAMTSGELFDLRERLESEEDLDRALDAARVSLALVVPPGFERDLSAGREPAVRVVVDGSNALSAQTALGYAELLLTAAGARLAGDPAAAAVPPLSARLRVLFNPELASDRFLLPGLIAMILMVVSTIATCLSIVKERETGTMEQLLVSPLSAGAVVLGKALPYTALSLAATALVLGTSRVVFGLTLSGNPLVLLLLAVLFVVGAQSFGLLISSLIASQQVAFQVATYATMLPSFVLSGFVFPLRSMPVALQALSWLVPARYFISGLRGVVLRGVGLEVLWPEVAALSAFAATMLGLAVWRLRRRRL